MAATSSDSLVEFHRFLGHQLQQGAGGQMSPEEVLARWREHQETLAAIRAGLADIEAGRTRPVEEVLSELKGRLPVP